MTWSQLHELYVDGNEIAGHTIDHPHLPSSRATKPAREICDDRVHLLNQGFPLTDFAYPFGEYNARSSRSCSSAATTAAAGYRRPLALL